MEIFVISLVVFLIGILGMAVGILIGRRSLKGTCGTSRDLRGDATESAAAETKGKASAFGRRTESRRVVASGPDRACHEDIANGTERDAPPLVNPRRHARESASGF